MLSTTIVHACRRCSSEKTRKNGHAENSDQRAKCLDCERTFVLQSKGARYDQRFKAQVVAAYQDRMNIRGITRTFGVCYETVLRWVGKKRPDSPRSWTRCCPAKAGTCSNSMNSGASSVPRLTNFGSGWPFVEERAKSWLGRSVTGACKVRVICVPTCPGATGVVRTRSDYWDA